MSREAFFIFLKGILNELNELKMFMIVLTGIL